MMNYKELIKAFESLSGAEKERALQAMSLSLEGTHGMLQTVQQELTESRIGKKACPHCNSEATIRRGKQKEVEKFSCRTCGKNFRSSHGTALYRIQRKDKWQSYLRLMEQGYSIKSAAKELGISIQTSFDWRHKILASLQSSLPTKLGGVVECDDFQLAESFKGQRKLDREARKRGSDSKKHTAAKVSVITAVSRGKGGMATVVAAKKISSKEAAKALENKLEPATTLITDEARAYNAVAKQDNSLIHKKVNSKENQTHKPKDKIHLQTVNNQHKQIRDFLTPFNGVATKYLPNYLNWFFYKQSQKNNNSKIATMLLFCLSAANALEWVSKIINNDILIRT